MEWIVLGVQCMLCSWRVSNVMGGCNVNNTQHCRYCASWMLEAVE